MKNPLAEHWDILVQEAKFCCEAHQEEARVMFMTGAMAALHAMTGWDPENSSVLTVDVQQIITVSAELTTVWHKERPQGAGASATVRH